MQAEMIGEGGYWSVDPLILNSKLDKDKCSALRSGRFNSSQIILVDVFNKGLGEYQSQLARFGRNKFLTYFLIFLSFLLHGAESFWRS
jgi:hypothetical protein